MFNFENLFRLDGQVAMVTGGTRGLGRVFCEALAYHGAQVVICSRHQDEAESLASELQQAFERPMLGIGCDVSVPDNVDTMVSAVQQRLGPIQVLINNAGINIRGPIDQLTFEQFQEVQRVNVNGVWLTSKAVVPAMKSAGSGRIINLASTLGLVGLADRTPYCSSKGAVVQMTRALAIELAPFNILVNAICPGPFLTEMNIPVADTKEVKEHIVGAVALNRWGRLEEIAGACVYLASPASSYVTGSTLAVDGGWTSR